MKFYFYPNNGGKARQMKKSEVLEILSEDSIEEAKQAHFQDPFELQSFFVGTGIIEIEF